MQIDDLIDGIWECGSRHGVSGSFGHMYSSERLGILVALLWTQGFLRAKGEKVQRCL